MTINVSHSPTLLDYIKNNENGVDDLSALAANSGSLQRKAVQEVQSSLVNLSSIDELVERIEKGDTNASAETVADMVTFYHRQVSLEVEVLTERFGLASADDIALTDGKWQFLAASDSETSEPLTRAEQQFINYLNKDDRLSSRISNLLSLTQLNELNASKLNAAQLSAAGSGENTVQNYLFSTRDDLNVLNFLTFENGKMYPAATGYADLKHQHVTAANQI